MSKILYLAYTLVFIFICSCTAQIPENDGFADAQFRPVENKQEADYYRIYERLDSPGALNINPNYTDLSFGSDGYGGFFNAPTNDFETSVISFYDFNNNLVLKGTGTTSRMLQTFILDGPAVWYENDRVVKRGYFKENLVTGMLSYLDESGNVIDQKIMLGSKEFKPNISKQLLGHWVCNNPRIKRGGGYFSDEIDTNLALHNEFTNQGTVAIWKEMKEVVYKGFFYDGKENDNIIKSYVYISYEKESNTKGVLLSYNNKGEVVAKEQIEFIDADTFTSTATEHPNPELVGKIYKFERI
ncbi:hypothetical protein [Chondrinema litorale]|uniref:hypothetical protein n=1 Tax=Chondrinema litorale TaxID=2994555 RepID=UPI002543BE08|nr:hypothetical protein [Chondrinema litorale]UZR96767.1 hypothetical protein OQ292_24005 [Chondrinema litorale]